jgi:hypothetical protein
VSVMTGGVDDVSLRSVAVDRVAGALGHAGSRASGPALDRSLRVTVNFQPDRRVDGLWLLEHLAADGWYRSRFETGHASGAVPVDPADAERAGFEHEIFGGWYDGAAASERPKYGALDFRPTGFGAALWYGSAHFRFSAVVLGRCTFCYPDSAVRRSRFGTAQACDLVRFAEADLAAGVDPMKVYVEAHIHGPLSLADSQALVLDPLVPGNPGSRSGGGVGCAGGVERRARRRHRRRARPSGVPRPTGGRPRGGVGRRWRADPRVPDRGRRVGGRPGGAATGLALSGALRPRRGGSGRSVWRRRQL